MTSPVIAAFDAQATSYDDRWKKMAPMSEMLHFLMRAILQDLPSEAQILCVGAGTGAEMLALASYFPNWRFTAVDPSAGMIEVCRQKANDAGIISRCDFHVGYIGSLSPALVFDAATSILVSHFITEPDDRRTYFRDIASHLRIGGYLVNADLASSLEPISYEALIQTWLRAHGLTVSAVSVAACCSAWGNGVAILAPTVIERMIADAGFEAPIAFYQALFIHGWYTRKIMRK